MTAKEALDKIRGLFADMPPAEPAKQEPAKMEAKEYVLEGGQKVLVSELEIGGMVQLVDDAGNTAPAPAGDHKLADGTTITLGENGLITAITVPNVEPEPTVEPGEDMAAKFAAIESENAALRAAIDAQAAKFAEDLVATNDRIRTLADVFSAMMQTPAANPLGQPKHNFEQTESKEDKLKRIADRIASLRK
jgi:hypothetical protein